MQAIPSTEQLQERLANLELYANLMTKELGQSKAGIESYEFELAMAMRHQVRELHVILSGARVEVQS